MSSISSSSPASPPRLTGLATKSGSTRLRYPLATHWSAASTARTNGTCVVDHVASSRSVETGRPMQSLHSAGIDPCTQRVVSPSCASQRMVPSASKPNPSAHRTVDEPLADSRTRSEIGVSSRSAGGWPQPKSPMAIQAGRAIAIGNRMREVLMMPTPGGVKPGAPFKSTRGREAVPWERLAMTGHARIS